MIGPVVTGQPVVSPVFLVGQAPGTKEGDFGRPFAWTAGKTMFQWFTEIGLDEERFRRRVYMAAVCRCFPGKNPKGGDRVPNRQEIQRCSTWLDGELHLLRPALILPVGKLAISRFVQVDKLEDVVGEVQRITRDGLQADVIPLPHPSGASTWHRSATGKARLRKALSLIANHAAWKSICDESERAKWDSFRVGKEDA
ncbi:MAG: uracil-DNA glycosylase family protein [Gammaproteobacteria bacterium]